MKILFISRAYPPVVGGIENQNYELSKWLGKIAEVKIIANTKGKLFLPLFIPYALIRALFLLRSYDILLLGDGVLSIIGWKLKFFYRKPVISIVHGLDLTFKMGLYQSLWVKKFIKSLDKLIAVGNETIRIGVSKGIPENKFVFVPNGVDTHAYGGAYDRTYVKSDLENILGESLEGKKVILTSGRLAKRKGVAWFVENVMPHLPKNIIYAVAGDGPDKENIENAIKKSNLNNQVRMLGYVTNEARNTLFNTCDLFIQPNVRVDGDMEGFGISVIEAGACRLPVVVSRLEGLKDAIKDGQNGFLVEPGNADAYIQKINELLANDAYRKDFGEKARQFIIENYSWDKIAKKYLEEIRKATNNCQ